MIFSLVCISFIVLAANFLGKNIATTTTDFLYLPVSGTLLILSIIISIRFKGKSDIGRAYIFFTGFATIWFIAELVWFISEIFYQLNPFPYVDDSLYLLGYPFLLLFSIYYLKPVGAAISKKMLAFAFLATALFLVPTFYNTYSYNPHANWDQIMWAGIYPLVDAILLFPTVIGMILFFKGNVGLLWSLMFFAILLNIIADSGFLYLDVDRTYYSGNPINLLYLWSYVLFSFGLYSHIKVFKKPKMKSFGNVDELK
ncbi:Uncharacterised protein [uncultured archaeon]|nr:Uncharacterised protein [uncultured archaeon]